MSDDPVWLSREAYDRLADELEHLRTEGRRQASAAIEAAREHGDLRENAEYDAAKDDQGKMELRIRQLEQMLAEAQVGDAPDGDTVAAGMLVTTIDDDGDRDEYLLGTIEDRVDGVPVISTGSPLGRALMGAQVGETVTYHAPVGELSVTVEAVRPYEGA